MLNVVCTHCRQTVSVAPDAEACSICGTNLKSLISEEYASDFFYARATQLALESDYSNALAEAQQGAYYANSPDLHLLAAILAERQSKYDLMRRHVGAIPIDDRLRDEGEWLVRSHQDRQRSKRIKSTKQKIAPERRPSNALAPKAEPQRGGLPAVLVTLFVVGGIVWAIWNGQAEGLWERIGISPSVEIAGDTPTIPSAADSTTNPSEPTTATGDSSPDSVQLNPDQSDSENVNPQPGDDPAVELSNEDNAPQVDESPADPAGTDPTDTDPTDDVLDTPSPPTATPEPIADAEPAKVADLVNIRPFDILAFLSEVGRDDLAALSVDAQIQEGNLTLVGVVPWAEHRREIIELAQYAPAVAEINAVDLVVRSPDVYKVLPGDTLWIIAYRLYDDAALWPQLVDANRDIIPSPEALRSDQVLRVPPKN